ncbi:MAG: hypothetical protein DRJ01_17440, partial [Bacteroidetes bacterium]
TGNGAASVVLNNKIYYFGGYNIYGTSNSIMTYDPATSNWYLQVVNGFFVGFSGAVSINNMIAFVVGGSSTSKSSLSGEIYRFDASTGSKTLVSDNVPAGEYFNCLVFDFDTLNKSTNSVDTCLYFWTGTDFYRYQVNNDVVQQFDTLNEAWALSTNVDELRYNTAIKIFPNPVKNYLQVSGNSKIRFYEIYNIKGEKLSQSTPLNAEFTVDVAWLKKGIYFIKLRTDKGVIAKQFVK